MILGICYFREIIVFKMVKTLPSLSISFLRPALLSKTSYLDYKMLPHNFTWQHVNSSFGAQICQTFFTGSSLRVRGHRTTLDQHTQVSSSYVEIDPIVISVTTSG